jgi:hypothetical protein
MTAFVIQCRFFIFYIVIYKQVLILNLNLNADVVERS